MSPREPMPDFGDGFGGLCLCHGHDLACDRGPSCRCEICGPCVIAEAYELGGRDLVVSVLGGVDLDAPGSEFLKWKDARALLRGERGATS